jgi:hypothetical protein
VFGKRVFTGAALPEFLVGTVTRFNDSVFLGDQYRIWDTEHKLEALDEISR